jgi:sialic acid synthase SpsE
MATEIRVHDTSIGAGHPCYVIAEIGNNHNGDVSLALRLIHDAKAAGADAVKFQKRTIDRIFTRAALDAPYEGPHAYGRTYGEHRRNVELPDDAWPAIFEEARRTGIHCFASVWDEESADFFEELEMPVYKIPSADLTNLPLLRHVAAKGKPVILSSGMSTLEEVDDAVATVSAQNSQVALLHCVSAYPFEAELANLRMITSLQERYPDVVIGYSGHEKSGLAVSLGAIALGASLLERHFTFDHTSKGTDHAASLEPSGLRELVEMGHKLESGLGDGVKRMLPEEEAARRKLAKSVTAATPIGRGETIRAEQLVLKSPGGGLSGRDLDRLVGRVAATDVAADEQLPLDAVEWDYSATGSLSSSNA